MSTDVQQHIDDLCTTHERDALFSGVCLLKTAEKTHYAKAFGYAHRGFLIKNDLDTRFDTASITKLFTTVAALQCIERGELSFETSIVELLDLGDTTISSDVTIYHLLTHTSGMGDDADEEAGEDYEALFIDKPNYSIRETKDFLPQFIHKPPVFKPGENCRYNNVAFVLLGLAIEKITGLTYRDYVRQHVFARLGMQHTEFAAMDGTSEKVAEGYDPVYGPDKTIARWRKNIYSYPPIGSPDSGAVTTAGDLDLFIRGLLAGDALNKNLRGALLRPKVLYNKREHYDEKMGFCFHFFIDNNEQIVFLKKDGVNPGVGCILSYYPAQDATLVLLANHSCDVWSLSWKIHEVILEHLPARPHPLFTSIKG